LIHLINTFVETAEQARQVVIDTKEAGYDYIKAGNVAPDFILAT